MGNEQTNWCISNVGALLRRMWRWFEQKSRGYWTFTFYRVNKWHKPLLDAKVFSKLSNCGHWLWKSRVLVIWFTGLRRVSLHECGPKYRKEQGRGRHRDGEMGEMRLRTCVSLFEVYLSHEVFRYRSGSKTSGKEVSSWLREAILMRIETEVVTVAVLLVQ